MTGPLFKENVKILFTSDNAVNPQNKDTVLQFILWPLHSTPGRGGGLVPCLAKKMVPDPVPDRYFTPVVSLLLFIQILFVYVFAY